MGQLDLFSDSFESSALPPYTVRESARAKHVSIKISVQGDVEIVVPPKFDRKRLPDILAKRQAWILQNRAKLLSEQQATTTGWEQERPEQMELRSHLPWASDDLPEIWQIQYEAKAGPTLCIPTPGKVLKVRGQVDHIPTCQALLKEWLIHQAHKDLVPQLRQLSFDIGLPFKQASIRHQKTRWASCSSAQAISLNCKLLFLPSELVRYVFIHELCHTIHMNHGRPFWALVGQKMPDYGHWRDQLKKGWRYVPRWLESSC